MSTGKSEVEASNRNEEPGAKRRPLTAAVAYEHTPCLSNLQCDRERPIGLTLRLVVPQTRQFLVSNVSATLNLEAMSLSSRPGPSMVI